ncbi:MAG TPA: hypothetical protein VFM94_03585 [Solirubrobacterales bacterium]|nr:hypothetical protein [Solirubrobacterales bacterium]
MATGGLAATASADPYVPIEAPSEPAAPEGQPSCPDLELEGFEGEDAAAGELRLLRGELAEACSALSDRLDRVRERAWWAVAEAVAAAAQRQVTNERLTELRDGQCKEPCAVVLESSEPLPVEDSAGAEYSDHLVSAIDASGESSKAGLWFLGGLLAMGFIAAAVFSVFKFWDSRGVEPS